jgi:hypothetical protein
VRDNLRMTRLIAVGFWADYAHPSWPDPRELVVLNTDERERLEVADYLDRGIVVEVYRGWSDCRICGSDRNGHADLTDGTYRWPEGLSHYVREHQVRLPRQFTAHVATRLAECAVPVLTKIGGPASTHPRSLWCGSSLKMAHLPSQRKGGRRSRR